jgi:hypothetical protein
MRVVGVFASSGMLLAAPLAAQDNPFSLVGGPVKSAYLVYEMTGKDKAAGAMTGAMTMEAGLTKDRWIMRMTTPFEMAGKKDTVHMLAVTTGDSQYTYSRMGSQRGEGEVSATLRPHLAREYAALDGSAKGRFRENVKLAADLGGSSDADAFVTLFGEKAGSETIAGQKCDVYRTEKTSACVLPGAPMVMLRWFDSKQGVTMVAKKVTLNGSIPPALGVLPKGVRWKKSAPDDADFIVNVWSLKKQTDPGTTPPAQIAQYVVRYLASPQAGPELREMGAGQTEEGEESPGG